MGLDAWGVKLKDNSKWETSSWDDVIDEFDVDSIIPKSNGFSSEGKYVFNNTHNSFITNTIPNSGFRGNPCCSRETMSYVATELAKWVKENPNIDWRGNDEYCNKTLNSLEIKDLSEYLTILDNNGCVMWFSW